MSYLFDAPPVNSIPVACETASYPIHRIFCVGRNYAAHALEMGNEVDREEPFYFTKSAQHALSSGQTVPFPPGTADYHHEMELVFVLGASVFRADAEAARTAIFAYGCGLDMTRRDLQQKGKDKRRPWDLGKDVENTAVFAELTPAAQFGEISNQRIHLAVNGDIRQDATLAEMIHSVTDIVVDLSKYYHLHAGDVIMTGTPAGVGAVQAGDVITGGIDGLAPISLTLGAAE